MLQKPPQGTATKERLATNKYRSPVALTAVLMLAALYWPGPEALCAQRGGHGCRPSYDPEALKPYRSLPCKIRSPENVPIQNCWSNASTIVALLKVGIAGLSATSVSFIVLA